MQLPEKNSLFSAMNRFIGAVNNMDQTVMVPSLLRDVPLQQRDAEHGSYLREAEADMYSYYSHLKSIRNDIEWGVLRKERAEKPAAKPANSETESEEEEEGGMDLEQMLQFHLKGLHGVLSELTSRANNLTNRYKQEIGIAGWGQ